MQKGKRLSVLTYYNIVSYDRCALTCYTNISYVILGSFFHIASDAFRMATGDYRIRWTGVDGCREFPVTVKE